MWRILPTVGWRILATVLWRILPTVHSMPESSPGQVQQGEREQEDDAGDGQELHPAGHGRIVGIGIALHVRHADHFSIHCVYVKTK